MSTDDFREITSTTLADYQRNAEGFREGTRDHDVSQNVEALLRHIDGPPPYRILDFGCGPGRDLRTFKRLGHLPVGLEGTPRFVEMARADSDCEVWQQNFLALQLPAGHFDGIFANASLFHVPGGALPRVLGELFATLRPGGVLFSPIPAAKTAKAGTASAMAPTTTTRPGNACWRTPVSSSWSTTTGRRACRASSSPGWPASGVGRPEGARGSAGAACQARCGTGRGASARGCCAPGCRERRT